MRMQNEPKIKRKEFAFSVKTTAAEPLFSNLYDQSESDKTLLLMN